MSVLENLKQVRERIQAAASRAGRRPEDIKLVAVTKTVPVEIIREAVQSGASILGENRPQELIKKFEVFSDRAEWHLIGHLQTNKVGKIIDKVALIHSLDSWRLAETVSRAAQELNREAQVLIQVNVAGEETKYGISTEEAADFLIAATELPGLRVRGLMTIAPLVSHPEEVRPVFRQLSALMDSLKKLPAGAHMDYLSMGMSGDFEVAIEEGASIIRIGRLIFGDRRG